MNEVAVSNANNLTFRQRWNHYLVLLTTLISIFIAINLRDNALYAVIPYVNSIAGIRAYYPSNWLIDTRGDYVFRVQDISKIGYKTAIQVSVQAVNSNTDTRNIVDALTLNRSQLLAAYRSLPANNLFILPNGILATEVKYTYAAINADPFLDTVPIVVRGIDIISIKRGQAVIITFLADSNSFDNEYNFFARFLKTFEF